MENEDNLRSAPVLNDTKWKYFRTTLLSSFLGGYKFSNEDDNIEISFCMHILQLFLYLLFPLLCFVLPQTVHAQGFSVSVLIPTVINTLLNILL